MKKTLLLTVLALPLLVPAAGAEENRISSFLRGIFGMKAEKKAEEEIHTMDPFRVSQNYDLSYSVPQVVRIIRPRVHSKYAGMHFELKFTVDRFGTPFNLGPTDMMVDAELVFQVINAVRAWQFSPARDSNGNPVERKVILPVIVVAAD